MNLYNLIATNPITGELVENIVDTKDNIIEISPIELGGDSLDPLDNGVESIILEGENIKVEITKWNERDTGFINLEENDN
ncbi:hypothetical protein [Aquimarina algiphila]|uniref:hypothetical protein n=1 Tax=Aquimarina algiphila TaxID=2047982 RepID=UPI0023306C6E|nr:hypothetical protein [Aquimarina algiphila]